MPDFNHVGLTVGNIELSYAFYHQVVGMDEWKWDREIGVDMPEAEYQKDDSMKGPEFVSARSEAFDRLTHNPGSEFKTIMLRSHDGLILQLVEYLAGGNGALEPDHARTGSMHLSFFVPDVEAKRREVEAFEGVKVLSDIVQILPTMRSFYAADPDGIPVEFLQVTDRGESA